MERFWQTVLGVLHQSLGVFVATEMWTFGTCI
jgi:hypothetical protein